MRFWHLTLLAALTLLTACTTSPAVRLDRKGTEIVVCGQLYDIGTPVVLWTDPGGYDAYRVERRFVPWEESSWEKSHAAGIQEPNRYNLRRQADALHAYPPPTLERIRGGGWDLPTLQHEIDQFVLHYDVAGTSRTCFRVLHDMRGLSVHFLLDVDGTIYQTLDVKERAWHATISNDRSIGIEIAHIGAYPPDTASAVLSEWYQKDESGRTRLVIPSRLGDGGIRTPSFIGFPATDGLAAGTINGSRLLMYDFTQEQYDALVRLTAALCTLFPAIEPDCPRNADGAVRSAALSQEEWKNFHGVLGHYHVQANKADPGPAMRWDYLLKQVRNRMHWHPHPSPTPAAPANASSAPASHAG